MTGDEKPEPVIVSLDDVHATVVFDDARAVDRNIAANARLFCSMLFAVCIAAFVMGHGSRFAALAVIAAAPVGLSCVIDAMPAGPLRSVASRIAYALPASVALILLLIIG